jgi:SAM-dependent methyltransferase
VRNEQSWLPSKLVFDARRRRYVPHPKGVSLGSRLAVGAQAEPYEKLLRENARGRMLDCGCGKVPFYEMYRKHVSSLTCIDWNDTGYSDRTVDLSGPLPFEPASFDTVLLSDVLEHIAEPEALMAEIARVLAPKGSLILTVPFLYHVHEAPHDYYRYTRFALRKLCDDSGLDVRELSAYGGYPDVLLDLLNKGLAKIPPLCHLFLASVDWTTRTRAYAYWREASRERFPLGYCLLAVKPG